MSIRPNRSLLLVNPWIHDFSAYDLWMKPLGLLYLGGILRSRGFAVSLLDCVDFHSLPAGFTGGYPAPQRREFGRGHIYKEVIPKPPALKNIPRKFRRYGLPPAAVKEYLAGLPRPGLILVTSLMTYWYPGVTETIDFLKKHLPGTPIFLGGIYATLCPGHAQIHSGADQVLAGPWDEGKGRILEEVMGTRGDLGKEDFSVWPWPAFDLYPRLDYVCLLTRCGCPFACTYCASSRLARGLEARSPEAVIREIEHWNRKFGVQNFAFYDDALLIDAENHLKPILREVIRREHKCNFHTPNAVHVKTIDEEMAALLFRAGFKTIRLGFETADPAAQRETGGKVDNRDFRKAVKNLKKGGYRGEEIGVYLLAGLPGQQADELKESLSFVREEGAKPYLVEYSPIPGTPLFEKAKNFSPFNLENEPLFHNNSLLPCRGDGFTPGEYRKIKEDLKNNFPR
jgi:pyruvate-formate lyase-activating enzyme